MAETLPAILRRQRIESLIAQAETIRDYPDGQERIDEAETHKRQARLERTLGNITSHEEHRIFSILSFAMPKDAPAAHEQPPIDTDEQLWADESPPSGAFCDLGCEACEGGRMTEQ